MAKLHLVFTDFFVLSIVHSFFTAVFSPSWTAVIEDGWIVVVQVERPETRNMDAINLKRT